MAQDNERVYSDAEVTARIQELGLAGPSPFDLPPLGGRFAGSWVALLAVLCGWAAVRDRADEARLSGFALVALPAGALIAAVRTIEQLDPSGAAAVYIALLLLLVIAGAAVTVATTGHTRLPDLATA